MPSNQELYAEHHDSPWFDTAIELEPSPVLEGETSADVVVIGAGYTGLRAALRLAEAGHESCGARCFRRRLGSFEAHWARHPKACLFQPHH